jgi:hypothetical protein
MNGYGAYMTLDEIVDRHLKGGTTQEQEDNFVAMAEKAYSLLTEEQKLELVNSLTPFKWK